MHARTSKGWYTIRIISSAVAPGVSSSTWIEALLSCVSMAATVKALCP